MENKVKQAFAELFKLPENTKCFECGEQVTQWASVNNGIFICDKCAVIHKNFGPNISSVRSITSDPWSDIHLAMMSCGGNARLRDFLEKYYIPRDGPMSFKYKTKGVIHYRKVLRAVSGSSFVPEPLSPEAALEIDETLDPNEIPEHEIGYETKAEVREDNGLDKVKQIYGQAAVKTKEGGKRMSEGIVTMSDKIAKNIDYALNDPAIRKDLKELGGKISEGARKSWRSTVNFFKGFSTSDDRLLNIDNHNFETITFARKSSDSLLTMPEHKDVEKQEFTAIPEVNENRDY